MTYIPPPFLVSTLQTHSSGKARHLLNTQRRGAAVRRLREPRRAVLSVPCRRARHIRSAARARSVEVRQGRGDPSDRPAGAAARSSRPAGPTRRGAAAPSAAPRSGGLLLRSEFFGEVSGWHPIGPPAEGWCRARFPHGRSSGSLRGVRGVVGSRRPSATLRRRWDRSSRLK